MTTGVVIARTGGTYRVHADGRELAAVLRGRLKHTSETRVVVGDVVDLVLTVDGPATITGMRARRSLLARRAAVGGSGARRAQPIAANVDQVVVVAAVRDPDPVARQLDRLLVIAEANSLPSVVVVNKVELDRAAGGTLAKRYAPAGYQVLLTSVKTGEGLPALRDLLRGRESVFTGASGVGKSSLLNAIEPGLKLRVGAISERWRTGKHTTVAAELVPLAFGGYMVDTPGLREVGAWNLDPDGLGYCFPEFRPYLDRCRFDNCRHLAEPECAVRRAAETEAFDPDRLVTYQRIYEEVSVPAWASGRSKTR
jgi:ribosome biogenesis GTPase / thiamine phosphate phosphatase